MNGMGTTWPTSVHYSDEEAMPTPRLRRRRTTGSSSRGSGDGRSTSPAYLEADGPPIQDPEGEPFNLWRSPDEFEEDDMLAIPEDYVPTPSTPDHWVPMSTRIQERRDRAEDALHGGKGKGKEKGKEKGGREIFRPGQGARLRPATPPRRGLLTSRLMRRRRRPTRPFRSLMERKHLRHARTTSTRAAAGAFPTTTGPTRASSDATGANWASATT